MKSFTRPGSLVGALLLLCGCQSSHYLYVQETVVGVDVGVGTSGNNRLSVGYTTDTFAVIPEKGDGLDAASSVAIIDGAIKGLDCFNYEQFNATGNAAAAIAKNGEVLTSLRETIYDTARDNTNNCQ
ncbi:hypothetical protein LJ739_11540 [Aestuariibacter halophilus]|uniref:Lipoprotein n=1 Tax=Fluctibacter halophilus TaxID=226011 RepID=A0ABS8GCF0_9ALTE|nr:hypothetical protein [Aestuariibacter halophilus]MCC2616876.1 hypothetical protein [Aestuariibacter halophilus]